MKNPAPCAISFFALGLLFTVTAQAAERLPAPGELAAIFEPFRVDQAVLSPDGRHVAYTVREDGRLSLVIAEIDRPANQSVVRVGEDASAGFFRRRVNIPATVNALVWSEPTRLIYAISVPNPDRNEMRDEIRVFDLQAKADRKLVDSFDVCTFNSADQPVPRRPRLVGIHPTDPDMLFVEAAPLNVPMPELYRVRISTGKAESQFLAEQAGRYLYDRDGYARVFEPVASTARQVATGTDKLLDPDGQATPEMLPSQAFTPPPGIEALNAGPDAIPMTPTGPPPPSPFDDPPAFSMALDLPGKPVFDYGPKLPSEPDYWTQTFRYRPAPQGISVTRYLGFDWQPLDGFLKNGGLFGFKVSIKNYYQQRSVPIAFDGDANLLYVASNVGRDTFGLYALDLRTKARTDFAVELPHLDLADPDGAFSESALVFDRRRHLAGVRMAGPIGGTRWLEPSLARIQETLNRSFTGRHVNILSWDDKGRRALVLVFSASDPGRYFVVDDSAPPRITEFFRRAPNLGADSLHRTAPFEFDTTAGVHLSGTLTLPRRTRITPAPLVLICRDIPGQREWPAFNREVQALASMGFAVATVNYRGLAGFGAQHRDAVREGFDSIPIADLRATAAWLAAHYPVHAKRVALFGEGFGGFIALRATQLFPDEFRCAVSINAPTDPARWIYEPTKLGVRTLANLEFEVRKTFFDRAKLSELDLTRHVSTQSRPVLLVQDAEKRDLAESQGTSLRNAMKRQGLAVEYLETNSDFTLGNQDARARVFTRISEFLNDHIYDYRVDLGKEKEVK